MNTLSVKNDHHGDLGALTARKKKLSSTILITGAGASAPFGAPTSSILMDLTLTVPIIRVLI